MPEDNLIDSTNAFRQKRNKNRKQKLEAIIRKMTELADRGIAFQVWQPNDRTLPPIVVNLEKILAHYHEFEIARTIKWSNQTDDTEIEGEEIFWLPKDKSRVPNEKPPTKTEIT